MAARADFDAQHLAFHGRASLKGAAAGAMHSHLMIVGVNTGFHEAPFCRVRSARQDGQGPTTKAASLGREAILNDTRTLDESKTREASGILREPKGLAPAGAPFLGGDFTDLAGETDGYIVDVLHID